MILNWITRAFVKKTKREEVKPPLEPLVRNRIYSKSAPNAERTLKEHLDDVFMKHHG